VKQSVTTYYLEMHTPAALRPAASVDPRFVVQRAEIPCPELNRFMYAAVGDAWLWIDRRQWTYQQWDDYVQRPELETWLGYLAGTPAGYFELDQQPAHTIEVAYFGLLPQFIGRGFGGALLTAAVQRAWQLDARRVWVHTCTLDSPVALQNYQARGFQLYDQETEELELPDGVDAP